MPPVRPPRHNNPGRPQVQPGLQAEIDTSRRNMRALMLAFVGLGIATTTVISIKNCSPGSSKGTSTPIDDLPGLLDKDGKSIAEKSEKLIEKGLKKNGHTFYPQFAMVSCEKHAQYVPMSAMPTKVCLPGKDENDSNCGVINDQWDTALIEAAAACRNRTRLLVQITSAYRSLPYAEKIYSKDTGNAQAESIYCSAHGLGNAVDINRLSADGRAAAVDRDTGDIIVWTYGKNKVDWIVHKATGEIIEDPKKQVDQKYIDEFNNRLTGVWDACMEDFLENKIGVSYCNDIKNDPVHAIPSPLANLDGCERGSSEWNSLYASRKSAPIGQRLKMDRIAASTGQVFKKGKETVVKTGKGIVKGAKWLREKWKNR